MQLINQVSNVEKVASVRLINREESQHNGNAFSQCFAKECRKQPEKAQNKKHDSERTDTGAVRSQVSDMDGELETYNHYARPAYFCMTIATTDLKG